MIAYLFGELNYHFVLVGTIMKKYHLEPEQVELRNNRATKSLTSYVIGLCMKNGKSTTFVIRIGKVFWSYSVNSTKC